MAVYVLVHGGGHGGWCYKPVAKILRAAGHTVYAPSLSGLADRKHLLTAETDLETHIADIVNLLRYEDLREVILVGHSYGGMVVTGALDRAPDRIGQPVYLDAAIPEDGEALLDVSPALTVFAARNQIIDGVELGLIPDVLWLDLFGIAAPALREWVLERLTPQPWKCFTQPLRFSNPRAVRAAAKTIINCTSTLQRRDAATLHRWTQGERVYELDAGHDLMLTEPEQVAELLLRLAG